MTTTENRPDAEDVGPAPEAHNGSGALHEDTLVGYSTAQAEYLGRGWRGVLPLPPRSKTPPPSGFTGREGAWPSEAELADWASRYPYDANLCLRLHEETVGIDVDAYGIKTGAQALDEAEKRWGTLPPTVMSSSRDDGVSGIRLFRVPAGTVLRDRIKFDELRIGDIEILQRHHRYLICWPSVHPTTKARYVWRDADGAVLDQVPAREELPELPETWLAALKVDAVTTETRSAAGPGRDAPSYDVTDAITGGRPSATVAQRLGVALYELSIGASRHDTMRGHILALLRFGSRGESGVEFALSSLYTAFVEAVGPDRDGGQAEAEAEFTRMVANARRFLDDDGDLRDPLGVKARHSQADLSRDIQEEAEPDAEFWERRDNLAQILRYSRARRAAPYAVLGCLLRRAIAMVPPNVQLPPIVGDNASVNFFTVSVGRSGQGKGIASAVARRAVEFVTPNGDVLPDSPAAAIGSGEGLARIFRGYGNSDELAQIAANVEVSEVSSLAALADRKGGTLVGELLKAYMGEPIGFQNAQRATTTSVAPHSYRLCLGVGAQPENTDVFLSREKDGLPQRFLWLPTIDLLALRPEVDVEDVEPARVVIPTLAGILAPDGVHLIRVPEKARRAVRDHHYLVSIGSQDVDPLDKHLMLVQLKAAFGLALLDSRGDITEEDWDIASHLIEVSNRTRAGMRTELAERRKRENSSRAHAQADRQAILDDRLTEERQRRIRGAILRKLGREKEKKVTRRVLSKAVSYSLRPDLDTVLDVLLDSGEIVARTDGGYELGSR